MTDPSPQIDGAAERGVFQHGVFDFKRRGLRLLAQPTHSMAAISFVTMAALGTLVAMQAHNGETGRAEFIGVVHASSNLIYDYDADGLTNEAEEVLGSSPYMADTDGDGFSDLEEFARHSDPADFSSIPLPSSLDLAMSASGEHDGVHLQIATFFTDGQFNNKFFQIGIATGSQVRLIPALLQQPGVTMKRNRGLNGGGLLVIDVPFAEGVVHQFGEVSLFATLTVGNSPFIDAAAGVNLASQDNIVMVVQENSDERLMSFQVQQAGAGAGGGAGPTSGSVYRPIPVGGGDVPLTWTPGEICYQATVEVGSANGVIIHEVIAADCISGWDASCKADCAASTGDTFQTFDPLGLVGG